MFLKPKKQRTFSMSPFHPHSITDSAMLTYSMITKRQENVKGFKKFSYQRVFTDIAHCYCVKALYFTIDS